MEKVFITCPHCQKPINILESHAEAEVFKYFKDNESKYKKQLREEELELIKSSLKNEYSLKLKQNNLEFDQKLQNLNNDLQNKVLEIENIKKMAVLEAQNKFLQQIEELKALNEKQKLLKENEILEIKEKIRSQYINEIEELKIANAKNKLMQNKTKGENFENEVESELRKCFGMYDVIEKINVSKDNKKADFKLSIKTSDAKIIGSIIYEVKNAEWKDNWEDKLNTDMLNERGKYAILIATSINEKYKGVPFVKSERYPNIWISGPDEFVFVTQILRNMMLFENNYELQIKKLKESIGDDQEVKTLIKEYEKKQQQIENFWQIEAPKAILISRKELKNIEGVSRTLISSSEKLDKAKERIEKQLEKKIVFGLSKILGNLDLEEEIR
ncbi:DUF2130 domain-containing protein [Spiroplasma endosymbiont of Crioceris asparagi]|uniref:DUF2130 domain-containing protein n=1 Tax=Spiroplasma endosymbiont of Crioceris asparagi TaxID=3066286 RepID=UPI0030D1327B